MRATLGQRGCVRVTAVVQFVLTFTFAVVVGPYKAKCIGAACMLKMNASSHLAVAMSAGMGKVTVGPEYRMLPLGSVEPLGVLRLSVCRRPL